MDGNFEKISSLALDISKYNLSANSTTCFVRRLCIEVRLSVIRAFLIGYRRGTKVLLPVGSLSANGTLTTELMTNVVEICTTHNSFFLGLPPNACIAIVFTFNLRPF